MIQAGERSPAFFVWGEKKGRNVYNVYSKGGTAAAECLGWRWDLRRKEGDVYGFSEKMAKG